MSSVSGIEASAVEILKRAIDLDSNGRHTEATVCYTEGIQLLMNVLKSTQNEAKIKNLRDRISQYMTRAEKLKQHVEEEKQAGKYHEQYRIASGSTGHSYQNVFGRFLDEFATEVTVEDPYIRSNHQIFNFLRFSELVVSSPCKITKIKLLTGKEEGEGFRDQKNKLEEIKKSLANKHNIDLEIVFSSTLHDREIRINNGWIIKIGRGLDYFKGTGRFSIGFCDMNLRECHETNVDIFHTKHTRSVDS